uniref:Uncharacterized protein n=1 Tax=Poecilia mexicana TaxID=48701 RepID=A0A3B3YTA0_9TELE
MEPEHRAVLRKFRVQLSDQLLISDTIVPFLYQEGVLTEAQVEQVEGQLTNRQKNLKLLDLLPNRGPRAFCAFLEALRDFGWIRDRLLLELQNSAGTGPPGPNLAGNGAHVGCGPTWLSRLAQRLGAEWEPVLLDLGLSAEAVYRCRSDHSLNTGAAVLDGLVLWRRAGGRRATVGRLLRSLEAADLHPQYVLPN